MQKLYGSPERGYIAGGDLSSMQVIQRARPCVRPGKALSDSVIVQIGKMYVAGAKKTVIARELGIDRRTVYRWMKHLGLKKLYLDKKAYHAKWRAENQEKVRAARRRYRLKRKSQVNLLTRNATA